MQAPQAYPQGTLRMVASREQSWGPFSASVYRTLTT